MTQRTETGAAPSRPRGGRPTKAAAQARDERLFDIATEMFLARGFEATSIDALAEAAGIGKATLYARYKDKAALFGDLLRRHIKRTFGEIEREIEKDLRRDDLRQALTTLARRLLRKSLDPNSVALARILSAQGPRFPDLARLAVQEGWGRQLRLVENVLRCYPADTSGAPDLSLAADLFLSLVTGRVARFAMLGVTMAPDAIEARTNAAVDLFLRGIGR